MPSDANNQKANGTAPEDIRCSPNECSGVGECVVWNAGETIEWYECLCDLWHTGQNCELEVPHPTVVAVSSTFLVCFTVFFCWYSSHRFSKKKIHLPQYRIRFADYLHQTQKYDKFWLKSRVEDEAKRTGKAREVPEEEPKKKKKKKGDKKKKSKHTDKKKKEKSVTPPAQPIRTPAEEKMEQTRQLEAAIERIQRNHETSNKIRKREKVEMEVEEDEGRTVSVANSTGPLTLTGATSATSTNLVPIDVGDDHRKKLIKKKREKKAREEEELREAEENMKKKGMKK
ncbi:hypothetical protein GCK72_018147 [Caenorhabditis remanei]|uniref:EGF-like domain-containing protein n=1 Tax=Caenorhabditis remanei TaxID=31234 RepID=A0A6A5GA87_CAERE|nr:hypothetical protein GCK72_018147 [Caenorhabditis remanei]KAF1751593.1 hypothetical protein GCK72_018147 [Caenorhabditis remanei]